MTEIGNNGSLKRGGIVPKITYSGARNMEASGALDALEKLLDAAKPYLGLVVEGEDVFEQIRAYNTMKEIYVDTVDMLKNSDLNGSIYVGAAVGEFKNAFYRLMGDDKLPLGRFGNIAFNDRDGIFFPAAKAAGADRSECKISL